MNKTKLWMLHVAMFCLVLGGCTAKQKKDQKTDYVSVKTIKVLSSSHVIGKNYEGTIEEEDGANVSFGVIGNVIKVMAEEGQFVRKGLALR